MSFSASPYKWIYDGYPLGIVEEAPTLTVTLQGEEINADVYGGNPIDYILQGGLAYLDIIFQEFDNTAVQLILDANTSRFGQLVNTASTGKGIGCPFVASSGGVLRAYPIGKCYHWAHWIAYVAVITPGQDIAIRLGTRLQNVPLRLQLLPYEKDDGNIYLFEHTTTPSSPIQNPPAGWADTKVGAGVQTLPEFFSS